MSADVSAWTDQTGGFVSRLNKTGIISGTGTYLASLNKANFKLFHCTEDGSGYLKDHVYLVNTDQVSVTDITGIPFHSHTSDADGSDFTNIIRENTNFIDSGPLWQLRLELDDWRTITSGTGSVTEKSDHVDWAPATVFELDTGSTNGSGSNVYTTGMTPNYDQDSFFSVSFSIKQTTDCTGRLGYGMETITAADDNARKYGLAFCTSTNGNYFVRTADGDSRSESDTGIAFTTGNALARLEFFNGNPRVDAYIEETASYPPSPSFFQKTTDIPTDNQTTPDAESRKIWKMGIKNSTGVSKKIQLYKLRVGFYTDDLWV